ncbi:hypothetical protein SEA_MIDNIGHTRAIN_89 [Arthrobacter phage MidnightRain]|nr:hypothetical protein SEA_MIDNIGHTRAIN_89 [Arthrobacter phage MidnightRain]
MSVTKVVRKARKAHRCTSCRERIEPGDAYLTHTALRGDEYYDDTINRDTLKPARYPIRFKECGKCATRYGRAEMLAPTQDQEAVPAGAASVIPTTGQDTK